MAIAVACDHCGKNYALAPTMAGKRVRCKACGQAFDVVATAPGGAASVPRPARQGAAGPAIPPPSAKLSLDRILDALAKFHANGWVLLACLPVAVGAAFLGSRMPMLWRVVVIAFPALAILFLLVGVSVFFVRAVRTPGELRRWLRQVFPNGWAILAFLVGGLFASALYAWLRGIVRPTKDVQERNRYNTGATQGFWALGVASMSLVMLAVTFAAGTFPPEASTHQLYRSPERDAQRMAKNEEKLRGFARALITFPLNHRKPPAHLSDMYGEGRDALDLRSPFNVEDPDAYVYIPRNVSAGDDDRIILYDRDELEVMGFTQAVTNSMQVLKLTKEQLDARQDLQQ